jgi:hypothetical protein
MADTNPTGAGAAERLTTADQDDRDQAAVLRHLLFLYPAGLTLEELIRELGSFSGWCPQRDPFERAVRDLTGVGLLHQVGPLVLPTRSAVVFHRLVEL